MANTLLTPTAVTREALRILHQKLTFIGSINRQYDDSFAKEGAKIGDTLKIRLPNQYTVTSGATLVAQDTSETSVSLQVATQKHVGMNFTSAELTMSMDDFSKRIIEPAMAVLAANVEADALGAMRRDVWQQANNTAAAITFANVLAGRRKLNDALAPPGDRTALLSSNDSANLVDALKGLFQDDGQIAKQYREGYMGRTAGFDFAESTHLGTQTRGSANGSYVVTTTSVSGATTLAVQTGEAQSRGQNAAALNANSQFNAGQANQMGLARAGFDTAANPYGAEAGNQFALAQGQLSANAGQFNAAAANQAGLANQAGINQYGLAQAGLSADAARYLAEAGNQASLANVGAQNQFALQQGGMNAAAGQFGAAAANQASLYNAGAQNDFALQRASLAAQGGMFNAAASNQAGLANAAAQNQFGLAQFGADTQNAQNYAAAQNQFGLADYQGQLGSAQLQAQLGAQAGQFNAGANNQMSQFNAGQEEAALARQLQAAGMLGGLANDYGAGTRADLGLMSQMGDQQRAIEQAYAMAGPAQLQLMGQLSGMTPYDILVGRQVNGNTIGVSNSKGTQVTSQTPSLFSQLLQAGQAAAAFI
jgi:predicted aconitase with swiveling domain